MNSDHKKVFGQVEFRMRRDIAPFGFSIHLREKLIRKIWMMGFRASLDFMIRELRGMEEHESADILTHLRKVL